MAEDDFVGDGEGSLGDRLVGIDRRAAVDAAELVEVEIHALGRCEAHAMLHRRTMKTLGGIVIAVALSLTACSKTDKHINDAVKERLANEPTPLVQLEITTQDRIVRLKGVVHDEHERERLERIVRGMDDVLGVDNRLTVARPVETTRGR